MSTEASGAIEPGVTAEGTDPTAAVSGERQAAGAAAAEPTARGVEEPSARGVPGPTDAGATGAAALVPGQVAPDDAEAADEAVHADEAAESGETADSGEAEAEEPDEVAAGYEDYGDDEDYHDGDYHDGDYTEHDGDYHDEDYHDGDYHDGDYTEHDEYGLENAAGQHRARRWPRMLLALGFVVLAAAIVGGAVAIVGSLTHGFKKPVKITYKKSAIFSLKTGQCFDPQGQSYTLIPCDSPHDAEVFATFTLSGTKWPGAAVVAQEASHGCASRLTGYLNPQLAISLSSTYVYPDPVAWRAGTKTVICEVRATSGQLTGSVRGASATAG